MVKFNPLIEKKIQESNIQESIKKFLSKALILELESSSAGTKYPYGKQLEEDIKEGVRKFKEIKNEN